jgi:hypothetical protein
MGVVGRVLIRGMTGICRSRYKKVANRCKRSSVSAGSCIEKYLIDAREEW